MIRKIITINETLCDGCGICVNACHEGAIGLVNGKAKLLREDYCDGLGDCLPACPANAITFEEREALSYNQAAVLANQNKTVDNSAPLPCGCPGTMEKEIAHTNNGNEITSTPMTSQLSQWPVQIKLVSPNATYFSNCDLLIAADCTAYAYAGFHNDFIKNHVTLIGCPKLDSVDYSDKLTEIFKNNTINSVTVTRMVVPCCGGIETAVQLAIKNSGKNIPLNVITVGIDGNLL